MIGFFYYLNHILHYRGIHELLYLIFLILKLFQLHEPLQKIEYFLTLSRLACLAPVDHYENQLDEFHKIFVQKYLLDISILILG